MPIPLAKLFHSDHAWPSHHWNEQVFRKAYGYDRGPLRYVVDRLQSNHSVLLYLHGSGMRSAAEVVKASTNGAGWQEFGLPAKEAPSLDQIWSAHTGLLESLLTQALGRGVPRVILHNLDMMADGSHSIDHNLQAKTALLYLAESTRSGVVLGLSDLSAGNLPDAIRRHFDEEVRLDAIPFESFSGLIPYELGKLLADAGTQELGEEAAFLLASRLRWIEPGRAVRMMQGVAEMRLDSLQQVLDEITRLARSSDFVLPEALAADPSGRSPCSGYERDTVEQLERFVVGPYRRWLRLEGGDPRQALRRLPQGLILHGPPGTGKSRLARWLAAAIGMPVRQVAAADLKRADWGLTERLVRELFRSARRAAPCMIVLDDADDLLPDRSSIVGGTASAERGVVNAFLQEIEGFGSQVEGVLVALTTNRLASLDSAARSRLPLEFHVPYPLTKAQVAEIVQTLGVEFGALSPGVDWPEQLLEALTADFFRPRLDYAIEPSTNPESPEDRRRIDKGLFSPRDIATAMRMLCADGMPDEAQRAQVKRYFDDRRASHLPTPTLHTKEP